MNILLVILLGICAGYDLRSKTIPTVWVWGCVGSMLVYRLFLILLGKCRAEETIISILPGIMLILVSYLGNQVGEGDGWLIIACGLCLGRANLMRGLTYAFLAAGIWGMAYLLFVQKNRSDKMPFIPSLFLGMLIVVVGDIV